MNKTISKAITIGITTTTIVGMNPFGKKAYADPGLEFAQNVSYQMTDAGMQSGPLGWLLVLGGAIVYEGVQIYDALSTNNIINGVIYTTKLPKLPKEGEPNSVLERLNRSGKIIERRYYDEEGRPKIDIDLTDHGFPEEHPWEINGRKVHKHVWTYDGYPLGKRLEGEPLTIHEYIKYVEVPEYMGKHVEK